MNFTTLQQITRERVGASSNDAAVGVANTGRLANIIKQALRRIEVSYPAGWDWLRVQGTTATVANQERYTFASLATAISVPAITKIVEVKLQVPSTGASGVFPLKRYNRGAADGQYSFTQSMVPQVYWVEGLALGLRPVPDAAYPMYLVAVRAETDLTAGADVPVMPESFHDAIVEKAAELWFRSVHDIANAQVANASSQEWLTLMRQSQRPYTGAGRVTIESDDWG